MPHYKLERQGYNVIVKGYRIVISGVCENITHEMRFNVDGHAHTQMIARNKIISQFMQKMQGQAYTPDGPTVYCLDCQEQCKYKGMEG